MKSPISVLVCDDHPLFRSGVVRCLEQNTDINVVAEASDGEACIAKLQLLQPDVLVMDLSMPVKDGFEVLQWINDNGHAVRAFILSMHSDIAYVERAKELGAAGFLAKEDAQSDLLAAVENTDAGTFFLSGAAGRREHQLPLELPTQDFIENMKKISPAERKVLELLTNSLTSREIAEQLNLSTRTVQAHRVSLAEKLNAKGANKLLELAILNRKAISDGH